VQPSRLRTSLIYLAMFAVFFALFGALNEEELPRRAPSELIADVASGEVIGLTWNTDGSYEVSLADGQRYTAVATLAQDELEGLAEQGVYVDYDSGWWGLAGMMTGLLPILVVAIVVLVAVVWLLRRAQGKANGPVLEMRKSRARLVDKPPETRFKDVGGCDEAKARLADVVDFLQHPEVWAEAGARVPRGVLLEGPPGTGKTLLARAVAGEAGVKFFVVSGSEFVEMFVGIGAARVRDLFEQASKNAPAVIFIDELDAIGRRRGSGIGHMNEEREQTLNQILVAMDGFEPNSRVVVIGATNRSDILDPALIRPGRFDLRLRIPPLDPEAAGQVLRIHARTKKLAPSVDLDAWASRAVGLSGAGLEQLMNDAALNAVRNRGGRDGKVEVQDEDISAALLVLQQQGEVFNPLDRTLVDSAWQLSRGDGTQQARIHLSDGSQVEGALVWADGHFLKLRLDGDQGEVAVARRQVLRVELPADPSGDQGANSIPAALAP
jgi:cell division protease FtsH